jgi:hypothetical protein
LHKTQGVGSILSPNRDANESLAEKEAKTLRRLLPQLEREFSVRADPAEWHAYVRRMRQSFPRLFERLYQLYGDLYDFHFHVEAILKATTEMWLQLQPHFRRARMGAGRPARPS